MIWRRTRASSTPSYLFQQTFLYDKIRGGEASRVDYLMHVIKSARFIISLHIFIHTYIHTYIHGRFLWPLLYIYSNSDINDQLPRNALVGKLYLCVTATVYTNTSKRFLFILFCLTLYVCMYVCMYRSQGVKTFTCQQTRRILQLKTFTDLQVQKFRMYVCMCKIFRFRNSYVRTYKCVCMYVCKVCKVCILLPTITIVESLQVTVTTIMFECMYV